MRPGVVHTVRQAGFGAAFRGSEGKKRQEGLEQWAVFGTIEIWPLGLCCGGACMLHVSPAATKQKLRKAELRPMTSTLFYISLFSVWEGSGRSRLKACSRPLFLSLSIREVGAWFG